jgi:glycerol-3-phosphate O-acyltransferase
MTSSFSFFDDAPSSPALTDYDRQHIKLYVRLLDAVADGADWHEAVSVLFGIDPAHEGERAWRVYASHLARARWMTEHGYRQLRQSVGP